MSRRTFSPMQSLCWSLLLAAALISVAMPSGPALEAMSLKSCRATPETGCCTCGDDFCESRAITGGVVCDDGYCPIDQRTCSVGIVR